MSNRIPAKNRRNLFVAAFATTRNATEAAKRAGYAERSAHVTGCRLLKDHKVARAIAQIEQAKADRYGVTADRLEQELAMVAFANMDDYTRLTANGERVVDLTACTREELAAVGEVTIEDYVEGRGDDARDVRRVKFKLHDRLRAIELLGKRLPGFFKPSVDEQPRGGDTYNTVIVGGDAKEIAKMYAQLMDAPLKLPKSEEV